MSMTVAIDVGNSRIKWGVHDGRGWIGQGCLPTENANLLAESCDSWPVGANVVASNVAGPQVEAVITADLARNGHAVRWVRPVPDAYGVHNAYEHPERLGADRWAALVGARGKEKGACLVVCAGTATTIDWLDGTGVFRGGLILPGVRMMMKALADNTAQLPLADGEFCDEPRNTAAAIVSGALHAQAGAIERMFAKVTATEPAVCLLTGGAAYRIAPCLGMANRCEPTLVLDGLLRFAS